MSYNVLVVDDSSIVRQMVIRTISMSGLDVGKIHEAGNGREALEVMDEEWVDIVFADIHMPEMNGIEMVEKMSEDNLLVSIPVVIVSSDHSQTRIDELKSHGIRAYMKKPFRPEGLRDIIEDVLNTVGEERDDS